LKIVQLITRMDEPGGAQIHVRDLSIRLKSSGHEVILLSGSEAPVFPELLEHGIMHTRIHHLFRDIHILKDIKSLIGLRRLLKEIQPDLLAIHSSKAGLIGRMAGWSLGLPTVFTAHGWSFTEGISSKKRWIYSKIEKFAGVISTGIISVSQYDGRLAVQHKVIPPHKMKVIQNGVPDIEASKWASPDNTPVSMIMVARFAQPKDHRTLLDVLSQMNTTEWKIRFVGDGPLKIEIEDEVKKLGLSDRVLFCGNRDDVSEILADSQIFILISNWEGLPLSVLEAMRSGLPVIASHVGGIGELVVDGKTGFLIEKGDKEGLKEKISQLMAQPVLRKQMGLCGRKHYLEHFTFEKMVNETLAFYQSVINKKKIKSSNRGKAI
jgi:glycosyltransferase involved in cell wall biosynthesis